MSFECNLNSPTLQPNVDKDKDKDRDIWFRDIYKNRVLERERERERER